MHQRLWSKIRSHRDLGPFNGLQPYLCPAGLAAINSLAIRGHRCDSEGVFFFFSWTPRCVVAIKFQVRSQRPHTVICSLIIQLSRCPIDIRSTSSKGWNTTAAATHFLWQYNMSHSHIFFIFCEDGSAILMPHWWDERSRTISMSIIISMNHFLPHATFIPAHYFIFSPFVLPAHVILWHA